jgi:AbrB family looped-hinge helix DNA binding protein
LHGTEKRSCEPLCGALHISDILRIGNPQMQIVLVGKRGTIVTPAKIRERYGLEEGSPMIIEEREDGILIRPA